MTTAPQLIVPGPEPGRRIVPRVIVSGYGLVYLAVLEAFPVWHVLTHDNRTLGSFLSLAEAERERRMITRSRRDAYFGRRLTIARSHFQVDGAPIAVVVLPEDRPPELPTLAELDEDVPTWRHES